jgi:hypothetical protein
MMNGFAPKMWQLLLGVGAIFIVFGILADGRNPILLVQNVFPNRQATAEVATSSDMPESTVIAVNPEQPTYTPYPTFTPFPTLTPFPTITPPPTLTPIPKKLAFYRKSLDDTRGCMSLQIRGINVKGWTFSIKNVGLGGTFDGGGNARVCGLKWGRQLWFTVYNKYGNAVAGGVDVKARDQAIMIADWK